MRLLSILLLVCIAGCTRQSLSSAELVSWVEKTENGLHQEKNIGPFQVSAQYRPVSYIICREAKKMPVTAVAIKKRTGELKGMEYFQLRIATKGGDPLFAGGSNNQEYDLKNSFLMFQQKNFVYMLRANDTIPCRLYQFVNYEGLAPYADIMLGFEAPENTAQQDAERELVYDDQVFSMGPVHFSFSAKEINSVPTLLANKQ